MRAGISTIHQTLTSEAASVLNQSIAEAGRRNHGQTTPLHVAATLLASSSGYLRQACIRSHPNSSHPLQCRALELCFSVALDRLPAAQNASPPPEPPISNALMAALKRAQAHQRRGCPEQQQQPLLAVKVELEQLIISILDDPSVSRVMREASFSSPAVKAAIEQSMSSSSNSVNSTASPSIGSSGLGFRPQMVQMANRNSYMNPRLQQQGSSNQSGGPSKDDAKKVVDILLRNKKRNPVLVGDAEPESVVRELLQRIERKEIGEALLRNVQVVSLEKEFGSELNQISVKLKELEGIIHNRIGGGAGVILNLGDLKWLVEQPSGLGGSGSGSGQAQQQIVSETGRVVVADIGKLLSRFREGNDRLWMIGTATCETYLRCQVYHPSMETDWDLQALPIAARTPLPGMFPRMGGSGILSRSVESLSPMKGFPSMMNPLLRAEGRDPVQKSKCCPLCMQSYEQELAQLKKEDPGKSSVEVTKQALPQWLQMAKPDNGNVTLQNQNQSHSKDEETSWKRKTEELQKKWSDKCMGLHPSFHQKVLSERNVTTTISANSLYNSGLLGNQAFQPKLQSIRNLGGTLGMNQNLVPERPPVRLVTPTQSPMGTDLALGRPRISVSTTENTQPEQILRDFIGCIPSEPEERFSESKKDKLANILDPDSFKSLFKGLAEKVFWQNEAASAVAAAVVQCRSGDSRRSGFGSKGDTWLLFAGPDRVGKKKMAMALSELLCRSSPVTIRLGSQSDDHEEADTTFRGKTALDRIAEVVQRNPSSVIVLEDFDLANMLLRGNIKRAFERGRLPDSYGREISLKNVIFILTVDGLRGNHHELPNHVPVYEEKLASLSRQGWQLHLSVTSKSRKRCADWLQDKPPAKARTDAGSKLSFDLNEAATIEDDKAEGSLNSSDLTVEHDQELNPVSSQPPILTIPHELLCCVDEAIVFKPVDFAPLRAKVTNAITTHFSSIITEKVPIEVDNEALEQLVGGIWFGKTELDEWTEKILVPSFHKLKNTLSSSIRPEENTVAKLISIRNSGKPDNGDLLPNKITVSAGEGSS